MKISRRIFGLSALSGLAAAASGVARASDTNRPLPAEADLPKKGNATPAFADAVRRAVQGGESTLLLPEGEFHFWPEGTTRRFLYVSNNDDAENDIVILLDGVKNFHIQGQDTRLIFHGRVTPFVLQNCSNIQLSGVSIDWEVPFHCEATVASVTNSGKRMELEFHDGFSFRVEDGEFYFAGEGFEQKGIKNILEFDPVGRETRFQVWDNFLYSRSGDTSRGYRATQLDGRRVRFDILGNLRSIPIEGNVVIVMPIKRLAPAVFVEDSHRISLRQVTVHHAGCMGLIAQTSSDIDLVDSAVVPSGDRFVSTNVDATHFVNCSGTITVDNCDFSHHIDDALNVHGIYVRVKSRLDDHNLAVEFVDFQQRGVRCIRPGDLISLADHETVDAYYSGLVEDADYLDDRDAIVTLSPEIPETLREGDVLNVLTRQANVLFRNNKVGKNRARGILLKTLGQLIVEGNYFHSPGSAIRVSGGVNHWYESGPTANVLIRNNVFDHCKYGVWGRTVIDVVCNDSGAGTSHPYHGSLAIIDNEFRSHVAELLLAHRVEHVIFKRNRILMEPYKSAASPDTATILLNKVVRKSVSDNDVSGATELKVVSEA